MTNSPVTEEFGDGRHLFTDPEWKRNTMEKKEEKSIGPRKGALLGGVMVAGGAIVIAQKVSYDVVNSQELTLLVVGVGFVVGATIGYLLAKSRAKK